MKTPNITTRILAVLLAATLVAACSSDDDAAATGDTTSSDTTTGTEGGTEAATTDGGETTDTTDGGETTDTSSDTTTDGGETTDTGDATADGTTDGGEDDPTCAAYCTAVTDACSGDDAQYADETACLSYCETAGVLPLGTAADVDGNTVGCRTYHAGVAASAPGDGTAATHCPHAGPSGAGVCGSWCENYCHLAMSNCGGDHELYADNAACMTACDDIEVGEAANPTTVTSGDTLMCRIYHLGVAGTEGNATATVHCPHGQAQATAPCVDAPTGFDFRTEDADAYDRVDRAGMPAINTAVISSKDDYNQGNPADDATGTFVPEIVASIEFLHTALDDDLAAANLVPCVPADCVAFAAPLVVPDTLKIDLSGTAGFPNGRALADPVIDITLAVVLLDIAGGSQGVTDLVGLNPTANDKGFLEVFPYLASPHIDE
ncbi:MAG: hypothetical protein ACI9WU_005534 [Myxococcota bacterium]|jgi:hypothetical protein